MPTLIVVDPGQERYSALCEDCARENDLAFLERTGGGEIPADFRIEGRLALDCDSAQGVCAHGHEFQVVREGAGGTRD